MIDPEKKLNILLLASWYPNRIEPQNGNFIQRHAEAVSKNCKVACLHVLSVQGIKGFEIDARWVNNVFEVLVYFEKTVSYLPLRKFNNYLKAQDLGYQSIIKEIGSIDLVHLNVFFPAGIFALRLKKKYRLPFIVTEHWTAFLNINPYQFNWLEQYYIRKIAAAASMICPVSEDLKNAIKDFGISGPFKVIPNVVDTTLFQVRQQKEFSIKKILHVSTLNDQHKNVSGILSVVARLMKEREDFKLRLVGNKFGDDMLTYARQLEIPDNILEIREEIPLEDIAQIMQEDHIFVLFSNYENLPCVISEAHASGMVVIATDVGGVREMIDADNGVLIKAKAEDELYEQLNQVMDRIAEYDIKEISKQAVERYSYQSVADQYLAVYKEALGKL
ncbi:MAG: glycosyltransferase involved in cell wall biosynthesis [Saprospiraceae bacterium]|jgi:glycosyltransferase involved in cell wall biosynthesis